MGWYTEYQMAKYEGELKERNAEANQLEETKQNIQVIKHNYEMVENKLLTLLEECKYHQINELLSKVNEMRALKAECDKHISFIDKLKAAA